MALSEYTNRSNIIHPLGTRVESRTETRHNTLPMLGALHPLHILHTLDVAYGSDLMEARKHVCAAGLFASRIAYMERFAIRFAPFRVGPLLGGVEFFRALDKLFTTLDGKLHRELVIEGRHASMIYLWYRHHSSEHHLIPPPGSEDMHLTARPLRSLSTVRLQGDLMFHTSCLAWMTETLNSSPITLLEIALVDAAGKVNAMIDSA